MPQFLWHVLYSLKCVAKMIIILVLKQAVPKVVFLYDVWKMSYILSDICNVTSKIYRFHILFFCKIIFNRVLFSLYILTIGILLYVITYSLTHVWCVMLWFSICFCFFLFVCILSDFFYEPYLEHFFFNLRKVQYKIYLFYHVYLLLKSYLFYLYKCIMIF